MADLLDMTGADPRVTQKRFATTPSGRMAAIEITGDDRLRVVKGLPSRWPEVIMARERGETLEDIARWAKVPPPCRPSCRFVDKPTEYLSDDGPVSVADRVHAGPECLSWLIAECYNHIEIELNNLAERRAMWLP